MNLKYMVCTDPGKAVKGLFLAKEEAMRFARKCTCPREHFRVKRGRLSEVLLVFELHDDGTDILLQRF